MPTPTSVATNTCSGSISQPQRAFANFARFIASSGIGPKYPVSDPLTISPSTSRIGCAISKSISATNSGRTSVPYSRHFALLRGCNLAKGSAGILATIYSSESLTNLGLQ